MHDPRVLISATISRPEEKQLLQALRAQSIDADIVLSPHTAAYLNGQVPLPDAVLVRNVSRRAGAATAHRFSSAGVLTINSSSALSACLGKDLQAIAFRRAGIPHPRSFIAFSAEQVAEYVDALDGQAVVKPVHGSWGRGVVRLSSPGDVEIWRAGWEAADASTRSMPVLVQRAVRKPGYDVRALVVGDLPVVAFRRHSPLWRTNTSLGAAVERIEIDKVIAKLCGAVVDLLGPGVYGIDLLECQESGELSLLEINTTPEFFYSSQQLGVDVAGMIAAYTRAYVEEAYETKAHNRRDDV
jgi:[lysine-biosynthesis-protein LysW]--L-2-aminoadipate ligase